MIDNIDLLEFLLDAKRNTYAATGDEASVTIPLLDGAKQLEFTSGEWLYRDIYFGMVNFSGQETVYKNEKPVWAMSYSGGMIGEQSSQISQKTYSFLRDALKLVSNEHPFRGPREYVSDGLSYQSRTNGTINRFDGQEDIFANGLRLYSLNYAGCSVLK